MVIPASPRGMVVAYCHGMSRRIAGSLLLAVTAGGCSGSLASVPSGEDAGMNPSATADSGGAAQEAAVLAPGDCLTDADCPSDRPYCAVATGGWGCQVCRENHDPHCPADRPFCVFGENALGCEPCRVGVSGDCPSGTWCDSIGFGEMCAAPQCANDPSYTTCVACRHDHCTGSGRECDAVWSAYLACGAATCGPNPSPLCGDPNCAAHRAQYLNCLSSCSTAAACQ